VKAQALQADTIGAAAEAPGNLLIIETAKQPDFAGGPAARSGQEGDATALAFGHNLFDGPVEAPGEN
jgi:hypothetical protein